jgi:hypothetical protein
LSEVLRVLSFHHTFKQEKLSLSYLEVAGQVIRNVESAGQETSCRKWSENSSFIVGWKKRLQDVSDLSNETDGSTDGEDDVYDDFAAELSKFHQQKLSAVPTKSCNLIDVILRSRDVISMADKINLSGRKFLMLVVVITRAACENIKRFQDRRYKKLFQ